MARLNDPAGEMRAMKLSFLLLALPVAGLAGCGSSTPQVTSDEAAAFKAQVVQQVPYMARYTEQRDFKTLDKAICSSLKKGQSYGNISDTTGAYIKQSASNKDVDSVIKVAVVTSCPEEKGDVPGL